MTEKLRCLVWACVNAVKKVEFNHHFTNPLPEDVEAREVNIDNATAEVTKCELELDCAQSSGCPSLIARATFRPRQRRRRPWHRLPQAQIRHQLVLRPQRD